MLFNYFYFIEFQNLFIIDKNKENVFKFEGQKMNFYFHQVDSFGIFRGFFLKKNKCLTIIWVSKKYI